MEPRERDRFLPCLFQRLSGETKTLTRQEFKNAVVADLERLLNATASSPPPIASRVQSDDDGESIFGGFEEIQSSVLNFGLWGLTGMTSDARRVASLERAVRWAIEHFEPRVRLQGVRARQDTKGAEGHTIRIEIRGELRGDPVPLHLITEFDNLTGRCAVIDA